MKTWWKPRSLFLVLMLAAPTLRAQSILPAHFGAWTASGSGQAPPETAGEAKDVFTEAGLESTETRSYSNGAATVAVTCYRFHDSSGAYQGFTYELGPQAIGGAPATNADAIDGKNHRAVRIGNIVVVVENAGALAAGDQDLLSRQIRPKAAKTPPPPIPNYLPDRDLLAGTVRYALGPAAFRAALASLGRAEYSGITDAAGFSSGAETIFARYQTSHANAVLLLIEYPTPQLAGLHWKHLEQALPPGAKQNGTSIERKGSLLAIVLAPSSAAYATRVREAVNYETQVTWNEPTHTITDPPITSVVVKIIMATGAFMLVAIVFGVAFGGVRVLLKALFPGKVFDRPEQMDVLQLGLSSKRINSRDFY
jgi:hypothetical protein